MARLGEADAVLVCVPTPARPAPGAGPLLRPGHRRRPRRHPAAGPAHRARVDDLPRHDPRAHEAPPSTRPACPYHLAYSPEREDPGRRDHSTQTIPKLVGGIDPASGDLAVHLYKAAIRHIVPVSSAEVAEAAKILENVYRAVNIALVNEMKVILAAMGVDVWEVIEAAATKPFGFQAFYPGPGLGGHCIPIDPFYLTWAAREVGQTTRFIELAGQVNHQMPGYVVDRTVYALNTREEGRQRLTPAHPRTRLQARRRRRPREPLVRTHQTLPRPRGHGRLPRPPRPRDARHAPLPRPPAHALDRPHRRRPRRVRRRGDHRDAPLRLRLAPHRWSKPASSSTPAASCVACRIPTTSCRRD